ncbi:hypothetical protein [Microbacterium sp. APC 3901]|uniref:hypothetical protein n=1 Tax=Microbacterium sp. APC 3901 TaxID=3035192 RepID=UPI0025B2DE7D|nr:hypothetical protein [Microbacterium sp. APC 3901]MDN3444333.1 hypothetical protein [Microbacterium sp. APC 3901]
MPSTLSVRDRKWLCIVDGVENLDDVGVVIEGRTKYPAERDYVNLWIVRLDAEGRATAFTEWYMPRPHQD